MVSGKQARSGFELLRDVNTKALAAHQEGRSEDALQVFASLIKAAPRAAVFHNNRAAILAELGRDIEALPDFERAVELDPRHVEALSGLGALLWRLGETARALDCYRTAAGLDPTRIDAHLAIFELAQIVGDRATALAHQTLALAIRRIFTEEAAIQPARRRILVIKAPGDWQANMPTEYILDPAANTVHTWYVDAAALTQPHALPEHNIIFNAVAESDEAAPILEGIAAFARGSAAPLLNPPAAIMNAARHRFPTLLQEIPRCIAPVPLRLTPDELRAPTLGQTLADHRIGLPFLLRPVASQAGRDLVRIGALDEIAAYLAAQHEAAFYLTPFYDYAAADGFFRKYRIIFVDGEPFPYHLAITKNWMVHYYNSGMRDHAWRRAEEARFLGDLGAVFDAGLQDALRRLARAIGLDYFGIDCAVTPDNQLLVFEVETGMIVHNLDPTDIYPYKPAAFLKISQALEQLLDRRTGRPTA